MKRKIVGLIILMLFSFSSVSFAQLHWKPIDDSKKTTKCGVIWARNGNFNKAITAFNEALDMDPYYAKAYNNRGIAWFGKGCSKNAIKDFNKAIEIEPDYADAFYNRGRVHAGLGEYDVAIEDYKSALKINPHFANAYFALGLAHEKLSNPAKALAAFKKALRLDPNNCKIYFKIIAVRKGKDRDALKFMGSLISKETLHKKSYYEKYTWLGGNRFSTKPQGLCSYADAEFLNCSD